MSINLELHLPSIISGKCLTQISLIIGRVKEILKKQNYLNCLTSISRTLQLILREERHETITRCWDKLENFKLREPTSSQPTSNL